MEPTQEQLNQMRKLIQALGWKSFMMNVGSLMAEQVDRVPEKQSSPLFAASNGIHGLVKMWEACGKFEYPPDMIEP